MRRRQLRPTQKYQFKLIGIGLVLVLILSGAACPPATNTPPSIKVTEQPTVTLAVNGDSEPSTFYVAGRQHRYQVEVKVELLTENANFNPPDTGVSIIWIDPFSQSDDAGPFL